MKILDSLLKTIEGDLQTDPRIVDEKINAKAYAIYYKAKIHEKQGNFPAIEKLLLSFSKVHSAAKAYKSLIGFSHALLLKSYIEQEKMDLAEETLKKIYAMDAQSVQSIYGSMNLGNKFTEIAEKVEKSDPKKYRESLSKSADYLYYWVSRTKADFEGIFRVGLQFFELQDWEKTEKLLNEQLYERFKDDKKYKKGRLKSLFDSLLLHLGRTFFQQNKFKEAKKYYVQLAQPDRNAKNRLTLKIKNTEVIFELASTLGGSIRDDGSGQYQEFAGTEDFKEALDVYLYIITYRLKGKLRFTDPYFNAKFHQALMEQRLRNPDNVKIIINSLEAASPDLGGDKWKPKFYWLKRKVGF